MPLSYTKKGRDRTPVIVLNDPLQWWKVNYHRFPILAEVARRVLAIPATSAQPESLFSAAGQIVSKRHSCLGNVNVELLIVLRMVWPTPDKTQANDGPKKKRQRT